MRATQPQHFRKWNGNSARDSRIVSAASVVCEGRDHVRHSSSGCVCIAGLLAAGLGARFVPAAASEAYDPWPGLVQDIFNNRPMTDGSDVIAIEMPYRAEDAAIVPVTLRTKLSPGDDRRVTHDHAGDRPESGADGGKIRARAGCQRHGDLDAGARQQLYRCACGGRAVRRQALHGQDLCEGVRRLLGARGEERRRGQGKARPDALPAIRKRTCKSRTGLRARRAKPRS